MEGTVKWYNFKKGYGFIEGEDGEDYFVHFTAVPKGVSLRENDKVSFEPTENEKGKQASNVQLLEKGSERADIPKKEEAPANNAAEKESTLEENETEADAQEDAEEVAEEAEDEEKKE
jgi:CspA family cold shock protein